MWRGRAACELARACEALTTVARSFAAPMITEALVAAVPASKPAAWKMAFW